MTTRLPMFTQGRSLAWAAILAILFAMGCAEKPGRVEHVSLHSIDGPGLADVLKKHRGQVVLVDFWATWCGPCMELLPHTIELQRDLGGRGLAVVTVNLDDPDRHSAIEKTLTQRHAATDNYLSVYGVGPAAFEAFGIEDGALPHVRIYDRQGKLRRTFASGGRPLDAKEIERAVNEAIDAGR